MTATKTSSRGGSERRYKVLFDHDGAQDDLLSLIMLLAMPGVELEGVVITPADCFPRPAMSATLKILRLFGRSDVEVSAGTLSGPHHFPRKWRAASYPIHALPILNESRDALASPVDEPGHEFLARKLREADEPRTVLVTGPLTNLARALDLEPDLDSRIDEILWMGGALDVEGNVRDYEHDGSAEWNAYWDPAAAHRVWQCRAPIVLFPLDATNHVPMTMGFLERLSLQRRYPASDLAGQIWATTLGTIPHYDYTYFLWDVLTTGYLEARETMTFREVRTEVIPEGRSAGRTRRVDEGGRVILAADQVDVDAFHEYLLGLFRR